jgi:hypothetical protein
VHLEPRRQISTVATLQSLPSEIGRVLQRAKPAYPAIRSEQATELDESGRFEAQTLAPTNSRKNVANIVAPAATEREGERRAASVVWRGSGCGSGSGGKEVRSKAYRRLGRRLPRAVADPCVVLLGIGDSFRCSPVVERKASGFWSVEVKRVISVLGGERDYYAARVDGPMHAGTVRSEFRFLSAVRIRFGESDLVYIIVS